jgi:hypothetical protein
MSILKVAHGHPVLRAKGRTIDKTEIKSAGSRDSWTR